MILFLGTALYRSAIYQFGSHVYDILKDSTKYPSVYAEVADLAEYRQLRDQISPDVIIYNYHYVRMPWLTHDVLHETQNIAHVSLHHEADVVAFKYYLFADPTLEPGGSLRYGHYGGMWYRIGRPLPRYTNTFTPPVIPTIGSFGIGVDKKNYKLLISRVNADYDQAIININIPGEAQGIAALAEQYRSRITKKGIQLNVTNSFMIEADLLDFLGKHTINVFYYTDSASPHVGISSATDYALAVRRPIAITKADRFRHLWSKAPEICLETHTIPQIVAGGIVPLQQFYDEWTPGHILAEMEANLDSIMRSR